VVRSDAIDPAGVRAMRPAAIVLSPGPCTPSEAGVTLDVLRELADETPLLGVCLGHQAIGQAFGGRIVRAAEPMHGRTSLVTHDGRGEFAGLPNPLAACRYHSLVIERASLPACLEVSAQAGDGTIMAVRHRTRPIVGVQFHPESILTDHGFGLLAGFLRVAGLCLAGAVPDAAAERPTRRADRPLPSGPVTF
jgi:anthranilate synthase component 2